MYLYVYVLFALYIAGIHVVARLYRGTKTAPQAGRILCPGVCAAGRIWIVFLFLGSFCSVD